MLHSTGGLGEMLKHLISHIQQYSKKLGLRKAEAPPHVACCPFVPKLLQTESPDSENICQK